MPLPLATIWVSHNRLRNLAQVPEMIRFAAGGGVFSPEAINVGRGPNTPRRPLIAVASLPDGVRMIRDGHHRAVSIWLGGRDHLDEREYVVEHHTDLDYQTVNLDAGFVTPFDIRTEVRESDFGAFLEQVRALDVVSRAQAVDYIRTNKSMYVRRREFFTIVELATRVDAAIERDARRQGREVRP